MCSFSLGSCDHSVLALPEKNKKTQTMPGKSFYRGKISVFLFKDIFFCLILYLFCIFRLRPNSILLMVLVILRSSSSGGGVGFLAVLF